MLTLFGKTNKKKKKKKSKKVEEDQEDPRDYCKGGYHPVEIGDVYAKNYTVLGKLGWGHFSTVWLCYDAGHQDFCALKIVRAAKTFSESAKDEIKLCDTLKGCQGCIQMYDKFQITGENGKHICMVFELAGDNLLHVIRKCEASGKPIGKVLLKQICKDVLAGLYEMESRGLIHTDIKPENILLTKKTNKVKKIIAEYVDDGSNGKKRKKRGVRTKIKTLKIKDKTFSRSKAVKLADFGNSCWIKKHFTEDIQTRQYRAPEVILGCGYGPPSDLWSFGCVVYELVTCDFLFNPKGKKREYSKNDDHLAQIVELIGPPPENMLRKGKFAKKYFDEDGNMKRIKKLSPWGLKSILVEKYKIFEDQAKSISDFLLKIIVWDPKHRSSIDDLIMEPWLQSAKFSRNQLESLYSNWEKNYGTKGRTRKLERDKMKKDGGLRRQLLSRRKKKNGDDD